MDTQQTLRTLAWGRIGFGSLALLIPGRIGASWIGPDGRRPGVSVIMRAFAVRDLAIGLGTLLALNQGAPTKPWAQAGVLSDTSDAVATLLASRNLPRRSRWLGVLLAGGAAVIGLRSATEDA